MPLNTGLEQLERKHADLEQLVSKLAADLSRVDNKSNPAAGTVAQRLETLEVAKTTLAERAQEGLRAEQDSRDELARLRAQIRDLICLLEAWAPDGDATSLPHRLRHLFNLTPNDLHTGPAEPT